MKNLQISMDELLREEEPEIKIEIPVRQDDLEKAYTIPADVWANRCSICIHKNGPENIVVPLWAVYKPQYADIIPCRIMTVSRPNDIPGECKSFRPQMGTYGICETCRNNNIFHEGYCMKEDHKEQRRVYYGMSYGGQHDDYWGRHSLSVCDDYEPDQFVKTTSGK